MRVVILIVTLGVVHFVLVDYIFDDYCLKFASGVIIRVLRIKMKSHRYTCLAAINPPRSNREPNMVSIGRACIRCTVWGTMLISVNPAVCCIYLEQPRVDNSSVGHNWEQCLKLALSLGCMVMGKLI